MTWTARILHRNRLAVAAAYDAGRGVIFSSLLHQLKHVLAGHLLTAELWEDGIEAMRAGPEAWMGSDLQHARADGDRLARAWHRDHDLPSTIVPTRTRAFPLPVAVLRALRSMLRAESAPRVVLSLHADDVHWRTTLGADAIIVTADDGSAEVAFAVRGPDMRRTLRRVLRSHLGLALRWRSLRRRYRAALPPHHRRLLDRAVRGRVLGPVHREDVTMPARGNALKRTVRSLGGKVLRRFRLLPGGMPDGLGDDAALAEASLEGDVVLYFPDTMDSLYQLRSWYGPLLELHRAQGVTIVCMDSRTAAAIRAEVDLPVVTIALDATLDAIILRSDTKLVLYVNYNPLNTAALRSRSAIHVSLLHGDSDKVVSVSNQIKAYDYSFVAGQAAIDRLERYTTLFDAPPAASRWAGHRWTPTGPRSPPATISAPPCCTRPPGRRPGVRGLQLAGHPRALGRAVAPRGGARRHLSTAPAHGCACRSSARRMVRCAELVASSDELVSTDRPLAQDFAEADLILCDVSAVTGTGCPPGSR